MKSEKPSFVATLYQRVGEWLRLPGMGMAENPGVFDSNKGVPVVARSEEDIRAGLAAIGELAKFQSKLRKAGVTPEEVKMWINEDRRV